MWNKLVTYSAGEELFGLAVTDYPGLTKIKKELNLLQKLYMLYNSVMESIDGYFDILWVDVDIEKINQELTDFQHRYIQHSRAKVFMVNVLKCLKATNEVMFSSRIKIIKDSCNNGCC